MKLLEETIATLIEPVIEDLGFELVRVRVTGSDTQILQIMAERPDLTMSAKDCAKLSRALSPVLEENDPLPGAYTLEVSSPGMDRPLTRLKDFAAWTGFDAKLELDRLVEGQKRFKGVIAGVEGDKVAFDIEGESETAMMPFAWIAKAQLVLTDELVKESLKAAKNSKALQSEETTNGDQQ